jgi:hypothetical protein
VLGLVGAGAATRDDGPGVTRDGTAWRKSVRGFTDRGVLAETVEGLLDCVRTPAEPEFRVRSPVKEPFIAS